MVTITVNRLVTALNIQLDMRDDPIAPKKARVVLRLLSASAVSGVVKRLKRHLGDSES